MRLRVRMFAVALGSATLLSCGDSKPPVPVELVVRSEELTRERFGREVRQLLLARRYDSLETLGRTLRNDKVKWPNGGWKLRSFYTYGFGRLPDAARETDWATHLQRLGEWRKLHPRSVTARVASAEMLVAYAWVARGHGTASEVTDSGAELMGRRLAAAVEALAEARQIGEPCPGWWAAAMGVALLTESDRSAYDRLFQEAIHHEPTYESFYARYAFWLLPRWHGVPGEWEAWLDRSLPAGAEGDELYARTVWHMRRQLDDDFWIEAAPSWKRTRRGFASLVRSFPQSLELRSEFAYLAWKAEDRETARQLFAELGPSVDPSVWLNREQFMDARRWAGKEG